MALRTIALLCALSACTYGSATVPVGPPPQHAEMYTELIPPERIAHEQLERSLNLLSLSVKSPVSS